MTLFLTPARTRAGRMIFFNTMSGDNGNLPFNPRLFSRILFSPAVDSSTEKHWRETPTWMAPHAKFFAVYQRPFWREAGFSGTAQSLVGPLAEIHDATLASGKGALLGFLGVGADTRAYLGEVALAKSCLEQLARLFGPEALRPDDTIIKDWAADPLTASPEDRSSSGQWVTGSWQARLSLGGSETSATEPGYMAGAVSAGARAVEEVMRRLRVSNEKSNKQPKHESRDTVSRRSQSDPCGKFLACVGRSPRDR